MPGFETLINYYYSLIGCKRNQIENHSIEHCYPIINLRATSLIFRDLILTAAFFRSITGSPGSWPLVTSSIW